MEIENRLIETKPIFSKGTTPKEVFHRGVSFSYLGERNHVDVSTISTSVLSVLPEFSVNKFETYWLKVAKEIKTNGNLHLFLNGRPSYKKDLVLVEFEFKLESNLFCGWVEANEDQIVLREADTHYDLHAHVEIADQIIHLRTPFKTDLVFDLMKMGKAVLLANMPNAIPRVVLFNFSRIPLAHEFNKMSMRLEPLRNSFYSLVCLIDNIQFGLVTVYIPR